MQITIISKSLLVIYKGIYNHENDKSNENKRNPLTDFSKNMKWKANFHFLYVVGNIDFIEGRYYGNKRYNK